MESWVAWLSFSPCLCSFTMARYWNSYQVSIPIFPSLSALTSTHSLFFRREGAHSTPSPHLIPGYGKEAFSFLYEQVDVQQSGLAHSSISFKLTLILKYKYIFLTIWCWNAGILGLQRGEKCISNEERLGIVGCLGTEKFNIFLFIKLHTVLAFRQRSYSKAY